MSLSTLIGIITAADVPPILLWFAVSLYLWFGGKRLYRFMVTIFLLALAFSIADLVRLRYKWTILHVQPHSSSLVVLGDRLFLFLTTYISTVVIYVVVFRQIRRRRIAQDPYTDEPYVDADDEKLAAAKGQAERVGRIEERTTAVSREYLTILERIKHDDPVFLPGTHKMGGLW